MYVEKVRFGVWQFRLDRGANQGEEEMAKSKSSLGGALGFVTFVTTKVMVAIKEHGEEILLGLSENKLGPVVDRFIAELIALARATSNIFRVNVGGNRTTEQVVAAGKYSYANSWINSKNFPWRRRQGKKTVELLDMSEHGFSSTYSFADALAVLQKLGLARPVYEDGLLFGEQHPEKQRERSIMFPHEPILGANGNPYVVYLWSFAGFRKLDLSWAGSGWGVDTLVAGIRES